MSSINKFHYSGAMLLAAAVALSACGGGKGGSSDDSRLDNPPQQPDPAPLTFCEDPEQLFTVDLDSVRPQNGAIDVSTTTAVTLEFSHEPLEASLTSPAITLSTANGDSVDFMVMVDGTSVLVEPTTVLDTNTSYTFAIDSTVMNGIEAAECAAPGVEPKFLIIEDESADDEMDDGNGNGGATENDAETENGDGDNADNGTENGNGDDSATDQPETGGNTPVVIDGRAEFTFTTGEAAFLAVTAVAPEDEARQVSVDSNVMITFNQAVDPDSVMCGDNVLLERLIEDERTPVTIDCNASGANVTLQPAEALPLQSDFEVTVLADGVAAELASAMGAQLEADFVSSFRTGGLVTVLDDELLSQLGDIPGLGDLLALLIGGGDEQSAANDDLPFELPFDFPGDFDFPFDFPFEFPEGFEFPFDGAVIPALLAELGLLCQSGESLACLDDSAVITLPLPSENGFENLLVAICDPKTPANNCVLSLALGVTPEAFERITEIDPADPQEALNQFLDVLVGEEGFLNLNVEALSKDGLGLLPDALEDGLADVFAALGEGAEDVPVLGQVFAALLKDGDVLGLEVGDGSVLDLVAANAAGSPLLNLSVLAIGENSLLSLDGSLLDVLAPILEPLEVITEQLCDNPIFGLICIGQR